ncbi:flagellar motor switch protein FliN [Sandarakinorhabdus sp. DWP1-3-1]|uniref:flagellar motor switch protein FliN n=1 Tax=Sandarakinorhabdus sp. DWP1-3-1 TaxID=2804627 RepID=UPI003CF25716
MNAETPGGFHADESVGLGAFGAITVRLSVEVGAIRMTLRDVLALEVGSVHALDRRVDQPVDVLINERLIARGEIVAIGDRFGVKLTEIVPGAAA